MPTSLSYPILHVTGTERVTPRMARITFGGHGLRDFRSVSPDQQAKFFFARPGQGEPDIPAMPDDGDVMTWFQLYRSMPEATRPWMRTFSIRRHHPERAEIEVDFVLHEPAGHSAPQGPAARWASRALVGDQVGMLGPAPSHFVTEPAHGWQLLVGDESALPAIAALLDARDPAGPPVPTQVYLEVSDAAEEQPLATPPGVELHWLHRDGAPAGGSDLLLSAVRAARLPEGEPFSWVAGESSAVRAVRRHLVGERRIDRRRVAFSGYWRLHLAQDDDLTPDDVAEREEVLAAAAEHG